MGKEEEEVVQQRRGRRADRQGQGWPGTFGLVFTVAWAVPVATTTHFLPESCPQTVKVLPSHRQQNRKRELA